MVTSVCVSDREIRCIFCNKFPLYFYSSTFDLFLPKIKAAVEAGVKQSLAFCKLKQIMKRRKINGTVLQTVPHCMQAHKLSVI